MTPEEISNSAFSATDISQGAGLSMPDAMLWLSLFVIYDRWRSGAITKEQGEKLKQEALNTHRKNTAEYEVNRRLIHAVSQMWIDIDSKGVAYLKSGNRTSEADAFYQAVYNCKPKESDTV